MRLATVALDDSTTAAVLDADRARVIAGFGDVGELLRSEDWLDTARRAMDEGSEIEAGPQHLRQTILAPGAVVCVGLNYRTHILEMGRDLPEHPTLFSKLPRALTDPYADIALPPVSEKVDYEAELAVVIGAPGRDISAADAMAHVAGFTVLNDVTMRDYQRRTTQWFAGKTFEASTPIGPWLVTADEFAEVAGHELSLRVNGEERQRAGLGDLLFGVEDLVADLSQIVGLRPGDIIATGTPGGVGVADGRFLENGDVVEVTIDGLGTIRNKFVATDS